MPPIGETLREARLRQKVDIADVEDATKIRAKYLRALENEEFDRLPGATFVRTFLRTYADYLGLDSQLLVEEYRVSHDRSDEPDVQQFTPQPSARPRGREPRRRTPTGGEERQSGGGGGGGDEQPEPRTVELRITPDAETYVCVEDGEGDQLLNENITGPETVEAKVLRLNL